MRRTLALAAALVALATPALADIGHDAAIHSVTMRRFTYRANAPDWTPGAVGDCKTWAAATLLALDARGVHGEIWLVHSAWGDPNMQWNHAVVVIDGTRVLQQGRETDWAGALATDRMPVPYCTKGVRAGRYDATCTWLDQGPTAH